MASPRSTHSSLSFKLQHTRQSSYLRWRAMDHTNPLWLRLSLPLRHILHDQILWVYVYKSVQRIPFLRQVQSLCPETYFCLDVGMKSCINFWMPTLSARERLHVVPESPLAEFFGLFFFCCRCRSVNSNDEHCKWTTVCCPILGEGHDNGTSPRKEPSFVAFSWLCWTSATWIAKLGGNLGFSDAALQVSPPSLW